MNDFDVKNGGIATVFFLGIPTEIDDEWEYEDCGIKFYNIPVRKISYDMSKGKYSLLFDGKYTENLKNIIVELSITVQSKNTQNITQPNRP